MAAVQLSNVSSTLLPPTITGPIFTKAAEQSAVMRLARKVPLSVSATTAIPVPMDVPTAGWVSEGGVKPVQQGGVGVKTMTGKKVALLVPVSQEVVMSNAAGLYSQMQQDLPTAIGRAFDYAAIHGLDLKTGGAGPFPDYLKATPNTQVIGSTAAASGGVYADLWKGVAQVAAIPGMEFSGFAADPLLRPEAALSVDSNGRPFFVNDAQDANSGLKAGSLIGYPVSFNSGVSGRYYRSGDAVQVATINGTPTGGTFTVTVGGATTSALAYNAAAATVQTAVQALGGATASTATVTGSAGGPYTITFTGPAAPVSVNQRSLTGGTSATAQATIAQSPVIDQGLRAIGGDFSQCAYGVGMDITIKVSSEANYYDGTTWHSAFQENLVLLLVEAYYGFVVGTQNAFVAYTHAVGS
jgi:hypothetical protein